MYVHDNTRKLIKFCLLSYLIPAPFLPKGQTARTTDTLRKKPSLHSQKFNPKFLGTAEAYFVCHIGPYFHISLTYVFIVCP